MRTDHAPDDLARASEASVVALARIGDRKAFAELVRRREGQVRGLLRRLSQNRDLADDLAQDAFLQAWRKLDTLQETGAFGGWLKRIAVNVWLQHARRQRLR